MVITPVALIIIILYRGSGLRDLRYSLMGISKEAKVLCIIATTAPTRPSHRPNSYYPSYPPPVYVLSVTNKLGESLSEIVPLDGTRDIFSTNTFSYVVTTVASTVAKGLQSLGWLM